jgi:hypothetical protein
MTNTDEGRGFVNQTAPITKNTTEYIRQLFPLLSDESAVVGAKLYADTNLSTVDQSTLVHTEGELLSVIILLIAKEKSLAIFICPTYYLLSAFNGSSTWKV